MSDTEMNEIQRALGRLEAKVDAISVQQAEIDNLRTRVVALEMWRSYLAGAVAILGALWGMLPFLLKLLRVEL